MTFGNDASYGFLGMCEIDEMLAHQIQAVFEGDEPCSATAYAFTPKGTEYAIQQLSTPFILDICGFEPVLSSREIWGNFSVILDLQPMDNTAAFALIDFAFMILYLTMYLASI